MDMQYSCRRITKHAHIGSLYVESCRSCIVGTQQHHCLVRPERCFLDALQFHLNDGEPVAMSIPATEHSVMTAWRTEREAMENMIQQFGSGLLACVMDSYDYVQVSFVQPTLVCWLHCLLTLMGQQLHSLDFDAYLHGAHGVCTD